MVYNDPHSRGRALFVEIEHPETGRRLAVDVPWRLSETPARIHRHAPLLGEHNQYVLGELLGMSAAEIDKLAEEKVVY